MADIQLADLLKVPTPDLQRALTKVPNRLIAVALSGADPGTASSLLRHVSPTRRQEIDAEIRAIGRVPFPTVQTAVKNLLKKALGLKGEETDADQAGVRVAPPAPRKPRRPPAPLTAEDFKAYLLWLQARHPLMKSASGGDRARALRLWVERLTRPPKE